MIRLGRTLWGFSLLITGCVLMVLPGPGLTTFVSGLVVLSSEYRWAKHATRLLQAYLLRVAALLQPYVE